jgi:hypothetical protein
MAIYSNFRYNFKPVIDILHKNDISFCWFFESYSCNIWSQEKCCKQILEKKREQALYPALFDIKHTVFKIKKLLQSSG